MQRILAALSVLAVVLWSPSCSTSAPNTISKVTKTRVDPGVRYREVDPSISFEQRHHLRGALTTKDYRDRSGMHYTVFWNAEGSEPVTVRFDYTQSATGPQVFTKEVSASAKGSQTTKFSVVGDEFVGPAGTPNNITSHRFQLIRGGAVLSEYKSALWR